MKFEIVPHVPNFQWWNNKNKWTSLILVAPFKALIQEKRFILTDKQSVLQKLFFCILSGPLSRFGPGGLLSSPGGSAYSTASSPSLLGPHPSDCLGPRGLVSFTVLQFYSLTVRYFYSFACVLNVYFNLWNFRQW